MVLQSIVEPIILAREADEHASGLPVPCDENFFGFRQTQKSRQIVLHLSQRRSAYWASRARRASALLRLS
jgi:hypothetical protein